LYFFAGPSGANGQGNILLLRHPKLGAQAYYFQYKFLIAEDIEKYMMMLVACDGFIANLE